MISLGNLKESLEKLKVNNNFDLVDTYNCIFSILNEYSRKDDKFLSRNSSSYKLLDAYFSHDKTINNVIKEKNGLYFPLYMEEIEDSIVINFIESFVMYFIDNQDFANEIVKQYKSYDFINSYKQNMLDFIEEKFKDIIGLKNIKEDLKDLVILITNNKIRKQNNMKSTSISMHMVFTGNPGTGKTTIARLIGQMYYKLGLIETDKFIEVSRQDLVAEYVGQTAIKTSHVLENAKGGILFIDEAYSLTNSSDNDYGKESIETLLKFMEDNRDNTIIIVAGYEKEMTSFIKSNPGLKSRFNKFFKFNNYSNDELYQIFKVFASNDNYTISSVEDEKIKKKFKEIDTKSPNFSNARYVRNIYDKTILNQAKRVDAKNITDKDRFVEIKSGDIVL